MPGDSFLTLQAKWRLFVDTVIITYVTGETPNPTDSGVSFARRARQSLRIDQAMIMEPDEAVRLLLRNQDLLYLLTILSDQATNS